MAWLLDEGPDPRRVGARGLLWAGLGGLVAAAHLTAPDATLQTEDAASAAAVRLLVALALTAAGVAALGLRRRGATLLGPVCAALVLVASLWLRPSPGVLPPPPPHDQPRPRALAPIQRLRVLGGAQLQRQGYTVTARWLASCALRPRAAPACVGRDGSLDLVLPAGAPLIAAGSELRVHAWVHPDSTPRNPGFEGAFERVARRGVRGRVRVSSVSALAVERAATWGPGAWIDAARLALRERLRAALPDEVAALVCGLGLGDRSAVRPALQDALRATGTSHVLAVSGTHVGVVVGLFALALGAGLGRVWPDLLRRAPRDCWLALPLVAVAWAYTALAGASASACRAATMVSVVLLWRALLRRARLAEAVGFAIVALVVIEPWALADLGLQLSISGVLGAVWGARRVQALWRPQARLAAATLGLLGASVGAFASTAAPGLPVFGALPLAAPVANLIVVPLVSFWLLPLSLLATLVAGLPTHAATDAALGALGSLLSWGAWPLDALADLPPEIWPWLRPPPALAPWIGLALGPALWAVTTPWTRSLRATWTRRGVGGLTLAACLSSPGWPAPAAPAGSVDVWMFDVGHGDATLLRFDDGTTMLVDGGGEVGDDGRVGRRAVVPALHALDVRRIDVMVVSHPHPDHENGLLAVARALPVGEFWSNGQPSAGAEHRALRELLRRRGTTMRTLHAATRRSWSIGSASVALHWPSSAHAPWDRGLGANDNSLVLSVRTAGASLLLAGDVEGPAERAMLAEGALPRGIDVLKVPHHGSRTSSSAPLLRWLQPTLAMAGARPWGVLPFPDPDVRARYAELGIPLWVTADGAIALRLGPDGWSARQAGRWLRWRSHSPAASQASHAARESQAPSAQPGGSYQNRTRWVPAGSATARNRPSATAMGVGAPSRVAVQPAAMASRSTSTPGRSVVASISTSRLPSRTTVSRSAAVPAPTAAAACSSGASSTTTSGARSASASMARARSGSTCVARATARRGNARGLRCRTRSAAVPRPGQLAKAWATARSSAPRTRVSTAARSSHGDGRRSCRFTR